MSDPVSSGAPGAGFPATRASAVIEARSEDAAVRRRACDDLVRAYWRPVYHHVRLKWQRSRADAEDLTQGFFAQALDKGWFAAFDPERGRFRTWIRTCLDGWVANELKAGARQKRGGGAVRSLDFEEAEGRVQAIAAGGGDAVERAFDDAWVRGLLEDAVAALREELHAGGRAQHFRLFAAYDLDPPAEGPPSYASLAAREGIGVGDVTNRLHFARREFRRLVLDRLRAITATEEEFRDEARALLGFTAP